MACIALELVVKISNVVVSLQDPASPNPRLSLCPISSPYPSTTTWPCHVGLFFFGSSDMQMSCLQGFCTWSVHLGVPGSSFMSWGLRASLSSCFHVYVIVPLPYPNYFLPCTSLCFLQGPDHNLTANAFVVILPCQSMRFEKVRVLSFHNVSHLLGT